MNTQHTFLLASQSPRRRQLLSLWGWPLEVQPADIDESRLPDESPSDYVRRLAVEKARALHAAAAPHHVIVAADTTVADGEEIIGKPASPEEAAQMLRQLRGRVHSVHTGVAVLNPVSGQIWQAVQSSGVAMRAYSNDEIQAYIASGDPFDKAGGYAIQNAAFQPVERLNGCFASVMGLPLCTLAVLLTQAGFTPPDIPALCQNALQITCDFYPQILPGRER